MNEPPACHGLPRKTTFVRFLGVPYRQARRRVVTENIQSQVVRHANSCFFTMVAVNEEGRPLHVAQLVPATLDERRRFEAAKARRELRRELEGRYRAMKDPTSPSAAVG